MRATKRHAGGAGPAVAALLVAMTTACGLLGATRISDIVNDPRAYDGKTVTVKGEVKESVNILVLKCYVISDGTAEITVVTDGAVPKKGETVRVTGTVHQAFAIGDKSLVVIRERSAPRR